MNRQLTLEEIIAKNERAKKEYQDIIKSGMAWEFFPELTGDWDKDQLTWFEIYDELLIIRNKYGK